MCGITVITKDVLYTNWYMVYAIQGRKLKILRQFLNYLLDTSKRNSWLGLYLQGFTCVITHSVMIILAELPCNIIPFSDRLPRRQSASTSSGAKQAGASNVDLSLRSQSRTAGGVSVGSVWWSQCHDRKAAGPRQGCLPGTAWCYFASWRAEEWLRCKPCSLLLFLFALYT